MSAVDVIWLPCSTAGRAATAFGWRLAGVGRRGVALALWAASFVVDVHTSTGPFLVGLALVAHAVIGAKLVVNFDTPATATGPAGAHRDMVDKVVYGLVFIHGASFLPLSLAALPGVLWSTAIAVASSDDREDGEPVPRRIARAIRALAATPAPIGAPQ